MSATVGRNTEDLLFIDKYTPRSFQEIKFNHVVAQKFLAFAATIDIPHIIIKGPSGSGKKTFANLYIKAKYGKTDLVIRQQQMNIKHANKTIEVQLLYSHYHSHIDFSVCSVYDRFIIQGFIKDFLHSRPIDESMPYHLLIIENADKLTHEAQQSLRRTLEKQMGNCRFIFLIGQDSTLIEPLMSRCVQLRLGAPAEEQLVGMLSDICQQETITATPSQLAQIARFSQRNVNTAVNLLQMMSICVPELLSKQSAIDFRTIVDIDRYIDDIVDLINGKKTPKLIISIRLKLYDLLVHCVEPIDILKKLYWQLLTSTCKTEEQRHQLVKLLVRYENTLKLGSKPIYHLEGFIVAVLNLLAGLHYTTNLLDF